MPNTIYVPIVWIFYTRSDLISFSRHNLGQIKTYQQRTAHPLNDPSMSPFTCLSHFGPQKHFRVLLWMRPDNLSFYLLRRSAGRDKTNEPASQPTIRNISCGYPKLSIRCTGRNATDNKSEQVFGEFHELRFSSFRRWVSARIAIWRFDHCLSK